MLYVFTFDQSFLFDAGQYQWIYSYYFGHFSTMSIFQCSFVQIALASQIFQAHNI